jgi:hypothetical protein
LLQQGLGDITSGLAAGLAVCLLIVLYVVDD